MLILFNLNTGHKGGLLKTPKKGNWALAQILFYHTFAIE